MRLVVVGEYTDYGGWASVTSCVYRGVDYGAWASVMSNAD